MMRIAAILKRAGRGDAAQEEIITFDGGLVINFSARQVTVDGNTYPLAEPFTVIATQNRVGTAGTQTLPYAQMDRFLIRLSIGYPDHEAQMEMLRSRQAENPLDHVQPVLDAEDLIRMRQEVRRVTVKDGILDYISRLAIASRQDGRIETGISPRGILFLNRTAQAHAWMDGRNYVTGSDIRDSSRILLHVFAAISFQVLSVNGSSFFCSLRKRL